MSVRSMRIVTAILLIVGAVLANVAFAGLGPVFDYPKILQQPPSEIFQKFTANKEVIILWFTLLALGAALLAPIAVYIARLFPWRYCRIAMWAGMLAAIVQVIGLSRWPLLVPGIVARNDVAAFELHHWLLGTVIGETLGYTFTGLWTIFVLKSLNRRLAGAWFDWFGYLAGVLILSGVLIPSGVPGTDAANFVGYVLWSVWLIVFAVLLLRRRAEEQGTTPLSHSA